MGWMDTLSKTYDKCSKAVADGKNYSVMLMPISHLTAEAQITITIDCRGNFKGAEIVDKGQGTTIVPVTEDSATRSSGISPYPLCDKLVYIAKDYSRYVESDKKNLMEYYDAYISQLEKWKESEYSTEKVEAIYNYVSKGEVMKDLIEEACVLTCGADGLLDKKIKISKTAQGDCFVRFIVLKDIDFDNIDTEYIPETWKDKELFDNFIKFNDAIMKKRNFCYISGEYEKISVKHPAKIRNTGDKAKLISSNNEKSFVFNGRFANADEAAAIGYETTQKAHNALRWLIGNQGYRNGSNSIVCWSIKGVKLPDVLENTNTIFGGAEKSDGSDDNNDYTGDIEEIDDSDDDGDGNNDYTGYYFAEKLNKAIAGYYQKIDDNDKIAIMSVDTADGSGNGRLSIKYYNELTKDRYLENIRSWYERCSWKMGKKVKTPIPKEIAMAAYGIENTEKKQKFIRVDEKVEKGCVDRVLPCIIDGKGFPKDIVLSAVRNVSRAEAFNAYNHNKIIAVTCAIIKAYYKSKGVEVTMELNDSNDRSYLFGRLLAVADVMEEGTYDASEKNRVTNARRYWSVFAQRPSITWEIIMKKIKPYLDKSKYKDRYNKLFQEIHYKLRECNGFNNDKLSPEYVLGYWCQRDDMYKKNEKKNENNSENKEEN